MARLLVTVIAALLLLGAGGAGALYAYDASRDDLVAPGVRAGGVDVGGLRAGAARALLEDRLAAPLERPLRVRVAGDTFSLPARTARVRVDVERMVQEALRASRGGGVLDRSVRDLSGERVSAEVPARVSYSRRAVKRLVERVERRLGRPARDARLSFAGAGFERVPARNGRALRSRELAARIERELVDPSADRRVRGRTRSLAPRVSTAELASAYPTLLVVDRDQKRLHLYRQLDRTRTYRIAVGQVGLETPAGLYHIQNKAVDPDWSVPDSDWAGDLAGTVVPGATPENPLKARWMGIYDGAGIHGTAEEASLGTNASHGCIRMSVPEVKELYSETPVGAPVYIA